MKEMDAARFGVLSKWSRSQYVILVGCALTQFAGATTITTMTFGMFLLPVSSTFGWTRDVMSTAYSVLTLSLALATPLLGRLIDRHDLRLVLGVGGILFAVTTAALALLTSSQLLLFALFAMWGVTCSALTAFGYTKIVAAWFDVGRGLAMGLMLLGTAVGSMVIPGLAQLMIQTLGWRAAYVGLGVVVLLVSVPAIFGLIRNPPHRGEMQRTGRSVEGRRDAHQLPGATAAEAIRSYKFWFVTIAMFLVATVLLGLQLHLFPILEDKGVSIGAATAAVTASGVAMLAGRLLGGFAMDRFPKEWVATLFFVGPVGTIAVLYTTSGMAGGIVAAIILGLCAGAEVAVASVLVAELFGLRAYGQIFSWVFAGWVVGCGTGPWLMAKSFVLFGSYNPGLLLLAGFAVAAGALTIALGRGRVEQVQVKA